MHGYVWYIHLINKRIIFSFQNGNVRIFQYSIFGSGVFASKYHHNCYKSTYFKQMFFKAINVIVLLFLQRQFAVAFL